MREAKNLKTLSAGICTPKPTKKRPGYNFFSFMQYWSGFFLQRTTKNEFFLLGTICFESRLV